MYPYKSRLKAVKLYIKFDFSVAATIRELGYPSRNMLKLAVFISSIIRSQSTLLSKKNSR